VTPTVAVAYGIVAVFPYAPNRYPALTGSGEVHGGNARGASGIAPCRRCHLRRPFCIAVKPGFVG